MRVAHILTSLNPGGIATYMTHVLPELRRQGVRSELILTLDRGLIAGVLEQQGYPIHICWQHGHTELAWSYRVGKLIRRSAILTFPARLRRLLRQIKPDIVHSHAHSDHWAIQLAAAHAANAPLLLTLHSPSSPYPQTWQAKQLFRRGLKPGDRLVGLSSGVYRAYESFLSSLPGENVAYPGKGLGHGFPDPGPQDAEARCAIRQQLGIPLDAVVVGSVGRLISHKRYNDLLEAVHRLSEWPDIHLLLVGDGSERRCLEEKAVRLGLWERVRFVGFQTNPLYWLHAIDICVLPSLFEGLGMTTLEAMARGVAFVGSDVAVTNQLIVHQDTGLLFPLGDVEALAGAILRLAGSPAERHRLGARARRAFLTHHTIDSSVQNHLALYHSMLDAWHKQGV